MKHLMLLCCILMIILLVSACELFWDEPAPPTLRVLIVALDYHHTSQFEAYPISHINGPIVDAKELAVALAHLGSETHFAMETQVTMMLEESGYVSDDDRIPSQERIFNQMRRYEASGDLEAADNDLFLFYYAGHGGANGASLITASEDGSTAAKVITSDELLERMSAIPGRKVLLLDTCHSGQAITVYPRTEAQRSQLPYNPHLFTITASAADQLSHESEFTVFSHKHGWFSYYLLEALGWNHFHITGSSAMIEGREISVLGSLMSKYDIPVYRKTEILLGDIYRYIMHQFGPVRNWLHMQTPQTSGGPTDIVLLSNR